MSRGFVKEEDQEEAPFVPPRASLPPGVSNYVTPAGYRQLLQEKDQLEQERRELTTENDTERRRALAVIDGKMNLLNERISSSRIIDPKEQTENEVRFGAKLKLKNLAKTAVQQFQIVGVDEADVKKQKIAFIAPLARAVTGKKKGDVAKLSLGPEVKEFEILDIAYD